MGILLIRHVCMVKCKKKYTCLVGLLSRSENIEGIEDLLIAGNSDCFSINANSSGFMSIF